MKDEEEIIKGRKPFKYEDELVGCEEAIEKYMSPPNGTYYRLAHNPLVPNDEIPQPLQKWDGLSTETINVEDVIPVYESVEDQWKQVCQYSPSFNVSDENMAVYFLSQHDKRKTQSKKDQFLKRVGDTVIAVKLEPNDGMIQTVPDDNGHLVFQPYYDFKLADHIDASFEARELMSYRDEKRDE